MQIFDLTHPITSSMQVFPGTERPDIITACTVEKHGFREKKITMFSHTGTHLDAPAHMLANGATLDSYPVEKFSGRACIYRHPFTRGTSITVEHLQELQALMHNVDFLLISTGWDMYWGLPEYIGDFPVLEPSAARWLMQLSLKGVGLDVISADVMESNDYPIHHILFAHDCIIIENLTGIARIPGDRCIFQCFPLYLPDADGSPARVVAMVD